MTEDRDALVEKVTRAVLRASRTYPGNRAHPSWGQAEHIAHTILAILPPTTSAGDGMPRKQLVSWMRERGLWQYELVLRGDGGFEETCRTKDGYGALGSAGDGELVERPIMLEIAKASDEHEIWERRFNAMLHMYAPDRNFVDRDGRWSVHHFVKYVGKACGFRVNPSPTEQEIPS